MINGTRSVAAISATRYRFAFAAALIVPAPDAYEACDEAELS